MKTFLNDVGTELVQTVRYNVVDDLVDDETLLFQSAVLQDVRDHIVSKFMRRQLLYHTQNLLRDKHNLVSRESLHDTLHNSAPILILAQLDDLDSCQFNDEVSHVVRDLGDHTLNHMVALCVVHALHEHLLVELTYEHTLTRLWENFKSLLDHTATILV